MRSGLFPISSQDNAAKTAHFKHCYHCFLDLSLPSSLLSILATELMNCHLMKFDLWVYDSIYCKTTLRNSRVFHLHFHMRKQTLYQLVNIILYHQAVKQHLHSNAIKLIYSGHMRLQKEVSTVTRCLLCKVCFFNSLFKVDIQTCHSNIVNYNILLKIG